MAIVAPGSRGRAARDAGGQLHGGVAQIDRIPDRKAFDGAGHHVARQLGRQARAP